MILYVFVFTRGVPLFPIQFKHHFQSSVPVVLLSPTLMHMPVFFFLPHLPDIFDNFRRIVFTLCLLFESCFTRNPFCQPPTSFFFCLFLFLSSLLYLFGVVEKFTLHIICDNCRLRSYRLFSLSNLLPIAFHFVYNTQWLYNVSFVHDCMCVCARVCVRCRLFF